MQLIDLLYHYVCNFQMCSVHTIKRCWILCDMHCVFNVLDYHVNKH
uniref:Uncharacterized protein n=1 Tax=Arundo donax TaxID=35708 RepID=A0A0A8Y0H5_ARUDO